jgi:uncharacterized membrane protein YedE/YeeE
MEMLYKPWPWYVAGPIIGLTVPLLLLLGNKRLGISSTLRHICAACVPANISLFIYDWKKETWNLFFAGGLLLGGLLGGYVFANPEPITISPATSAYLQNFGIDNLKGLMPTELFNFSQLFTLKGFFLMVVGGFLVGFGTRYMKGCTSGHGIFGLSTFEWTSLLATVCFFLGGILFSHFVLPYILNL